MKKVGITYSHWKASQAIRRLELILYAYQGRKLPLKAALRVAWFYGQAHYWLALMKTDRKVVRWVKNDRTPTISGKR